MKKVRHKYKLGSKLKFKFFDGGIRVGEVTKLSYEPISIKEVNYEKPTYTITVPNYSIKRKAKEYHYPCIKPDMILESY